MLGEEAAAGIEASTVGAARVVSPVLALPLPAPSLEDLWGLDFSARLFIWPLVLCTASNSCSSNLKSPPAFAPPRLAFLGSPGQCSTPLWPKYLSPQCCSSCW